jgi:hypothetical protein
MRRWQAAIAVTAFLAATTSNLAAQQPPHSFSIRLLLPDADLTPSQAAAMKSEVATICAPLALQIAWQPPLEDREQTAAEWTAAIDIRDRVPIAASSAPQPLGAVAVIEGRMHRTIYVSRGKVRQFVDAAGIRVFDGFYDRFYGRFLGRIVAHELGHLLLDSAHHRDSGLMRRRFDVRDVLSNSTRRYEFDADDLLALRALRQETPLVRRLSPDE